MKKVVWSAGVRRVVAIAVVAASVSCGSLMRQGQGSSYLIIAALEGSSGAAPGTFSATLESDVVTDVNGTPAIFSDTGQAQFQLALKDPGPSGSPNTPSVNNFITIDRYHVSYARTDGRNTPGVDVPYAFDGAVTATVTGAATVVFTIVRSQAKDEAPLRALGVNGSIVSTIAEVTFYGHDQTGRAVSATGRMSISFANFGDPT
jgi:hypothetical protein